MYNVFKFCIQELQNFFSSELQEVVFHIKSKKVSINICPEFSSFSDIRHFLFQNNQPILITRILKRVIGLGFCFFCFLFQNSSLPHIKDNADFQFHLSKRSEYKTYFVKKQDGGFLEN